MTIDLRIKGATQPTREEFLNENNVYVGYKGAIAEMQESELDADVPIGFPESTTSVLEEVEETYFVDVFNEETGEYSQEERTRLVLQPKLDVHGDVILRQQTWREYCANHVYQSQTTSLWSMECGKRDSNGNRLLSGMNEDEFIAYSNYFGRERIVPILEILNDRVIEEFEEMI